MTLVSALFLLLVTVILFGAEAMPLEALSRNFHSKNASIAAFEAIRQSSDNCVPKVPLTFKKTASYGGNGGSYFDDTSSLRYDETLKQIIIHSGNRIDRISFQTKYTTYHHGGNGGTPSALTIYTGEKITSVTVCTGVHNSLRVYYLSFETNTGRIFSKGRTTSTCRTIYIPSNMEIVAGYGRSASELDNIGFVLRPPMCKT